MEMGLTIFAAFLAVLLGSWGTWRGVRSGLFALTGTLLAATLINLWGSWIRERIDTSSGMGMAFAATTAIFLTISFIVGYGGSMLFVPPPKTSDRTSSLAHTVSGGLSGILNAMLLFSFLLHYAVELGNLTISATRETAVELWLWIAYTWLPWYILAVSVGLSVWIIARLLVRLIQNLAGRQPASTRKPPSTAWQSKQPAQTDQLEGISSKIDQALGESPRRR